MYYKLYLSTQLVKRTTEKALLFEMENHPTFGCVSFWFPKSLAHQIKCKVPFIALNIPDTFVFTLTNHMIDENSIVSSQAEDFSAKDFVMLMKDYNDEIKKLAHIS